jgi:uncharacterized protein YecE (DUF72 family)
VTSDFVYARLHGDQELYASGYDDKALERWAARVRTWQLGGTPTDGHTLAPRHLGNSGTSLCTSTTTRRSARPFDAISLAHRLGVQDLRDPPGADWVS